MCSRRLSQSEAQTQRARWIPGARDGEGMRVGSVIRESPLSPGGGDRGSGRGRRPLKAVQQVGDRGEEKSGLWKPRGVS